MKLGVCPEVICAPVVSPIRLVGTSTGVNIIDATSLVRATETVTGAGAAPATAAALAMLRDRLARDSPASPIVGNNSLVLLDAAVGVARVGSIVGTG